MLQSTDAFPLNFGFTGKGNSTVSEGIARDLEEQIKAGAIGYVVHNTAVIGNNSFNSVVV